MLPAQLKVKIRNSVRSGTSCPLLIVDQIGVQTFSQIAKDNRCSLWQVMNELNGVVERSKSTSKHQ